MKMEGQILLINIENIIPNRFQPRINFDEEALNELAESIKEHGIIEPIVVRRVGPKYEIIAGERRYKAAIIAGLSAVPAIVAALDDNESAEVAIVENTHRRSLSAIEEAKSYQKLLERKYVTQDQLAKRLGTSQSNIANKIRLLTLDQNVQEALLKNQISERHARSLLKVTDKQKQVELLNRTINENLSVRSLEDEINRTLGKYAKTSSITGTINTNNRFDVDIDNIVNNSMDIITENTNENVGNYEYNSNNKIRKKKRDSIFFNNLENESANMDPTHSVGFNLFNNDVSSNVEKDYDILEDDDEDDDIEEETQEKTIKEPVAVKENYTNQKEVINAINRIIANAKENEVDLELEEFTFDNYYQCIIRVSNDNTEKK